MRHGTPALIILLLLALIVAKPAAADRGDQKWFKTYPEASTNGHGVTLSSGVRQPDGKVVIAGTAQQEPNFANADWIVIRIDPATGGLDTSFGVGGVARIAIDLVAGGVDNAHDVTVAPSGRIYVAGDAETPQGPTDMAVAALTSTGSPDTGFGPQGVRTVGFFTNSFDRANTVLADAGGVTIAGLAGASGSNQSGFGLARFDHSGNPFPGGQPDGRMVVPLGGSRSDEAKKLLALPDGDVIALGTVDLGAPDDLVGYIRLDQGWGSAQLMGVIGHVHDIDAPSDALLDGDRVVVATNHLDSAFRPYTEVSAATIEPFAQVEGYGGTTFGSPSLFGGLDREADGTIVAGGIGPRTSDDLIDDWRFVPLGNDGRPSAPLRNHPNSAGVGERGGAIVVSDNVAVLLGNRAAPDVAAAVGVDLVRAPPGQIAQPPPPPPPGCTADVRLRKTPFRPFSFISVLDSSTAAVSVRWDYAWDIEVSNTSRDCAATGVVVQDRIANFTYERHDVTGGAAEVAISRTAGGIGAEAAATVTAEIASIPPGGTVRIVVHGGPADVGSTRNQAVALWSGRETRSNVITVIVTPGPVSKVATATAAGIEGTAAATDATGGDRVARGAQSLPRLHRLARVEVAVRRLGPRCRWLASRRGRFRTVRARGCPPVWLRARGTTRWRLRFARRLPRGRYEVLTRALNRAGVSDDTLTRAERSRVSLRVR